MSVLIAVVAVVAAAIWMIVLLLPWQAHRTRERLEAASGPADLAHVAVLIPARNEAPHIARTLAALAHQGPELAAVVVDDESTDGTGRICARVAAEFAKRSATEVGFIGETEVAVVLGDAQEAGDICTVADDAGDISTVADDAAFWTVQPSPYPPALKIVRGAPLSMGWTGKLWALEQGARQIDRPFVLLLDADIELAPWTVPALLEKATHSDAALVSVMAELHCLHFWERLLVPAFIFFFKLLYPFSLVESGHRAGAAGGCMLVRRESLQAIGGHEALRNALIDDCTLAAKLRSRGFGLSLAMSRSVRSLREYPRLREFWRMVSRTAFTQLGYSWWLLLATTVVMLVVFAGPLAAVLFAPSSGALIAGAVALALMACAYWPVIHFYRLTSTWAVTLPIAGLFFLAMTWSSAIDYARGTRATWKDRAYETSRD